MCEELVFEEDLSADGEPIPVAPIGDATNDEDGFNTYMLTLNGSAMHTSVSGVQSTKN
jgi:hypothetical protein